MPMETALNRFRNSSYPDDDAKLGNALLDGLPYHVKKKIAADLEPVVLDPGSPRAPLESPSRYLYFPVNGTLCSLILQNDRERLEVAVVGREGFVDMSALPGGSNGALEYFVQLPGPMLRIDAGRWRGHFDDSQELRDLTLRHLHHFISIVSQNSFCNSFHSVEKRICRWLLMHVDRVGEEQFSLTQQFLSEMLGVNRATVSLTAGDLQKKGLIRYSRGRITVVDRRALERTCCDCYHVIRKVIAGSGQA